MRNPSLSVLCLFVLTLLYCASLKAQDIKGYFPYYRSESQANNLNYNQLSDLIFAFGYLESDGSISIPSPQVFAALKTQCHATQTNLHMGIGGWGLSENFGPVSADPQKRAAFVQNCVQICQDHQLAGIDIDWEFPSAGQRDIFTALLRDLKQALTPHGLELSVAVGGEQGHMTGVPPESMQYPDFVHIMAYDGSDTHHATMGQFMDAIELWLNYGVQAQQIVAGVPFYGRCAGEAAFTDISNDNPSVAYQNDWHNGYCYNGAPTLQAKVDSAMQLGCNGIMIWEVTHDRMDQYSLLAAIDGQMDQYRSTQSATLEVPRYQFTYGDPHFDVDVTSSEPGPLTFQLITGTSLNQIDSNLFAIVGAGCSEIKVLRTGPNPDSVLCTACVQRKPLMYSAHDKSKDYGDPNPPLTFDIQGWVGNDSEADLELVPWIQTNATSQSNTGIYPIYFQGGSDDNYDLRYENALLSVERISPSLAITSASEATQGDIHTFLATSNSDGAVTWSFTPYEGNGVLLPNSPDFVCVKSGGLMVRANLATGTNYESHFVEQWFVINPLLNLLETSETQLVSGLRKVRWNNGTGQILAKTPSHMSILDESGRLLYTGDVQKGEWVHFRYSNKTRFVIVVQNAVERGNPEIWKVMVKH